ncbi:hypothetical protein O181_012884 [Austropuccinia psidii MF-1]|uniref:Uncharacterized protein n=1 Tax=Austropuccinia psidii MF-1 TaxID=1389203 RepID=A0A9Q3GNA8_9BASI|nr:hypothetical protein [Austropuccinia psidii MF-1]
MSDSMIIMKIFRRCGGELEDHIKCKCLEPCSTEDYINSIEDIITRTMIGKTLTRNLIKSREVPKTSRDDRGPQKPVLKCHKCGRISNSANTCTKKTTINQVQVIKEAQCP